MKRLAVLLPILMAGCNEVTPVTNETTGPTITFTQTATGSASLTQILVDPDGNAQVTFNALANDPGGVKEIGISFDDQLYPPSECMTLDGAGYGGGTFPYGPIPADQTSTSSPNAMGQVPTELFIVNTLQGPFTCDLSAVGIQATARPYGDTIHATVSATNYSNKTTTAILDIVFGGWP